MYIESLITPYERFGANGYSDEIAEPFIEAAGILEARAYLHHAPDQHTAKLEVIAFIQACVRETLFYPDEAKDTLQEPDQTALDTVSTHQQSNCIGHTYVGSEALSAVGIEHFIGYVNRHFMVLIPGCDTSTNPATEETRLYSFDMLSPRLNQDLTGAISHGTPQTITTALQEQPSQAHAVMLHTDQLAANLEKDVRALSHVHPWLNIRSGERLLNDDPKVRNTEDYRNQYRCVMSIYTAEAGRDVMEHYVAFRRDITMGRTALALDHLRYLDGRYPEADCRAAHFEIRSLVGSLCLENSLTAAIEAVEMYCARLIATGDPRGQALRGDLLRQVGSQGNPVANEQAIRAYQIASTTSRIPNFSQACIGKADKLRQRLHTPPAH